MCTFSGVSPPLTPNNIPETLLEWGKQGETALKQLDSTRPPEMNAGDVTSTETMEIPGAVRQGISQSEDSGNDKDSLVLPDHSAILQVFSLNVCLNTIRQLNII